MISKTVSRISSACVGLLALAAVASPAYSAEYAIDPTHSFVEFKTQHLGFSWLAGRFNTISGVLNYDPAKSANDQKIVIEIDTASVDTNYAERDKHLRSADFLDTERFPTAKFVSTGFDGDANGGTLTGDLTLHGVTKSISFDIKKIGEGDDPWGGYRAGFEGSYDLVRKDFDMGYNLGPAAEVVKLDLYIEAIRQ
ncbi:YceI family protein [Sneathiella aquimaris]|uniref:YceI family protein n=1 Tax=Sneathiella aquimaris TaxID=2599305 RepID=UPI00146D3292|nr:YceI family protein [Sneathiella aquimaris]